MPFLQPLQDSINTGSARSILCAANIITRVYNTKLISILPFANVLDGPAATAGAIPCNDYFVQLISSGLGAFLYTLMEIGGALGLICIILGGLLRIAALTTQKKDDKDDRMLLSKFAFLCAIIVLIPTFIFFLLLVLLPYWFGLGDKTCH